MNWKYVHRLWALCRCPRKLSTGAQTLCILLMLCLASPVARADCPAAPIGDPDDMAISFLRANGVQAASASLLASSAKEGTLVYDDTATKLKICDGTNWIEVGSGSGSDTLASLSCTAGEIPKWNGTAWACAADGGGGSSIIGPAFSAHNNNVNLTVATNTPVPVVLSTKRYDTTNAYSTSTGRFTPTVAGKYLVVARAWCPDNSSWCQARIYKNGAHYSESGVGAGTGYVQPTNAAIVDMNGTTDYVEMYVYNGGGTTISGVPGNTSFEASLIGGGAADTLSALSCATNEIPKWNGSAWACAADGGGSGSSGAIQSATQATNPLTLADGVTTDVVSLTASTTGTYTILANGYTNAAAPWAYLSSNCDLLVNGTVVHAQPFYYGAHDAAPGSSPFFPHTLNAVSAITAGQVVKVRCMSTSSSATRTANKWRIDLVPVGGGSGGGAVSGFMATSTQSLTTTMTTIAGYTEGRDDGNGLNASTGIFTVPAAGYYAFSATVFHANGSGDGDLYIASSSAGTICREYASPITSNNVYRSCSGVAYLAAGSTVYVQAKNGGGTTTGSIIFNGSALGGSGSGSSTLAGLTDVAVGTASNGQSLVYNGSTSKWEATTVNNGAEISASSYRNTAQSITSTGWQVLNMEAEEWDTANMISVGTNPSRITIPAGQAGRYLVTAYTSADMNASGGRWLSVYKNGALLRYCSMPGNAGLGGNQTFTCSWNLDLSAGDYVELAAYQNSGSTLSFIPRLSVAKMSGGAAGGGSSQWTDVTGGINYAGGKVGIGTTAPAGPLHVVTTAAVPAITMERTGDANVFLEFESTTGLTGVDGGGSSGFLRFYTAGAQRMIVNSAGNIGIGTTTPQSLLQVAGGIQLADDAAACPGASNVKLGTLKYGSNVLSVCNTGGWTTLTAGGGTLSGGTSGYLGVWTGATTMGLSSTVAGQSLFWDATNHRLGIGTTNPQDALDLGLGTSGRSIVWGGSTGTNHYASVGTTYSFGSLSLVRGLKLATGGADQYLYSYATGSRAGIRIGGGSASDISFFNEPAATQTVGDAFDYVANTKMTIKDSGNVGVGTTAPSSLLHVKKDQTAATTQILVENVGAADPATISALSVGEGGVAYGSLRRYRDGSGTVELANVQNAPLHLLTNNIRRLTILGTGNVGIGTTSPTAAGGIAGYDTPLYIANAGNPLLVVQSTANGAANLAGVALKTGISTNYWQMYAKNGKFTVGVASVGDFLTIDGTGNVGIGTTSPAQKLDVSGIVQVRTTSNGFLQLNPGSTTQNGYVGFFGAGGTRSGYVGWGNQGNVHLTADTGMVVLQAGASGWTATLDNAGSFSVPAAAYKPGGGAWAASSDARLKDIDGDYDQGLDSIIRLNPIRFHYKKDNARKEPSGKSFVGLIAQEVQKAFPEAVSEGRDGYLSLDTTPINFAVINAIKELKADNDNLRAELQAANENYKDQDAALENLRREIDALKAAR